MGALKLNILSKKEKAEKDIAKQMRYTPHVLIVFFASMTAILRFYLMPEWGWWHLLLLIYQCFIFAGFWQLIKYINKRLNKVYPFERGPIKRMALQNLITILAISPLIILSILTRMHKLPGAMSNIKLPDFVNDQFLATMMLMVFVVLLMFNFAFYSFHFFEHWQETVDEKANLEIEAAQLEKEKAEVQYHQLKNQVNPHYLFNTLTSLDGLIHTNPELASEFVQHMAKVYRYVLQHKESEVVNVYEELEFIEHYIELLQIRYGKGIVIHTKVSEDAQDKGIVMVTLQMLIDNAIKHNSVQASAPLKIVIWDGGDYLIVHNNKQVRKQIETSNGTGLNQLRELYGYLTDKEIIIEDKDDHYTIKIPLL